MRTYCNIIIIVQKLQNFCNIDYDNNNNNNNNNSDNKNGMMIIIILIRVIIYPSSQNHSPSNNPT